MRAVSAVRRHVYSVGLAIAAALALAGCAAPPPAARPCGVIIDDLRDVRGRTAADDRRIDRHFERGVGGGCWTR